MFIFKYFFETSNSSVSFNPSYLVKNSLRKEGKDNGEFEELFKFCKNEVICGDIAKKGHY